jgi:hypothetical protein
VKVKPTSVVLGAVGLGVGVLAVLSLREATLSTHGDVPRDSRVEVVIDAASRNAEPGQTLDEMVHALVLACRLEVNSDLVGPIRYLGDGHFRAVLTPALDETNRRQLGGCLRDWTIDSVRADVVGFRDLR